MAGGEHVGGVAAQLRERDAAEAGLGPAAQAPVELADRRQRVARELRDGMDRVARHRGDGGGAGALALDVADHRHPAAGDRERARRSRRRPRWPRPRARAGRRRPSPRSPAGRAGSRLSCSVRAICARSVNARAFATAIAGAAAELLGERQLVVAEGAARLGGDERQRAERLAVRRAWERPSRRGTRRRAAARGDARPRRTRRALRRSPGGAGTTARRAGPPGSPASPAGSTGYSARSSRPSSTLAGSTCAIATGRMSPCGPGHVDAAPVGQLRHGELRHLLQRALVVQRRGEDPAAVAQQALARARPS